MGRLYVVNFEANLSMFIKLCIYSQYLQIIKSKLHIINFLLSEMSLLREINKQVQLVNRILLNTCYVVQAKVSQGSYGEIYRVRNKEKNKIMALKVLHIQSLRTQKKYHQAIIQSIILRKLSHPFIIKAYQIIPSQQFLCLVLDYCPYGDMFQLMNYIFQDIALSKRKKNLFSYYLNQLLQAMGYLHSLGIVHRDLKPQNIMLGADMKLRLIDFGTAKVTDSQFFTALQSDMIKQASSSNQQRKSFVGTAQYLSPQAIRSEYSQKSDIWAFGVIVYKFFHNTYPFQGQAINNILQKILTEPVQYSKELDPQIQQLISLCLKKDALERPTIKMLRMCSLFKGHDPKQILTAQPPLHKEDLKYIEFISENQFEMGVEKKMFFGNFKPRMLVIYKDSQQLIFAYRYVGSKQNKNSFQLSMNDYCQRTHEQQFRVVTQDKKYEFRIDKSKSVFDVVEKINWIIREHYNLQ